jgi:glycosyltransferase involved in cell wall biosynthesis
MEGTPVAVLEASAAGLPVISTRHAGIPDAVIHGETGFLCAEHDVQQMAEYMMEVIENKALAKNVGQKGRALVRQEFTLEKHLKILSEAIKNTVD